MLNAMVRGKKNIHKTCIEGILFCVLFCLDFIFGRCLCSDFTLKNVGCQFHQRGICEIQNCKTLRTCLLHLEFVNILTQYSPGGKWYVLDEFWM